MAHGYVCINWSGHPELIEMLNRDLAHLDLHNHGMEKGIRLDDQVARVQIEISAWLKRQSLVPEYAQKLQLAYRGEPCDRLDHHLHEIDEEKVFALVDPVEGSYLLSETIRPELAA